MNQKYKIAISLSVALHFVLAMVLLFGNFTSETKVTPTAANIEPIQAVVVDKSKFDAQVKRLKKAKADDAAKELKRIKDLEERASQAKKRRAKEQQRLKTLEKERKKKETEKRKADDAAKVSKAKAADAEKELKRKVAEKNLAEQAAADAQAKRKREEAAVKKAEELRKKQEADRRRKAKEAKERAEQERLLEQQMAEEMAARNSARKQQVMDDVDRNKALIGQAINRSVLKDQTTMAGKSCILTISIAPSGFVTNVVVGKGDRIVCDAAKTGIYRVGTLPITQDPEVYKQLKKFTLKYIPNFD